MKANSVLPLVLFFGVILALVVGGYGLFIWFVINIVQGGAAYGLLFVAAVAGVASFFNPCAFPLLPAYLAQYYTTKEGENKKSSKHILLSGFAAALGVTVFNLLLGLIIGILGAGFGKSLGLAGENPSLPIRWLRGIVGAILLYLGFSHLTGRGNPFAWLSRFFHPKPLAKGSQQEQSWFKKLFAYGFGYTLLGIGCGGPILGGLFIFALSQGGFLTALLALAVYSFVMASLMILVSTVVAFSKEGLLGVLRQSTVKIQRLSGILLLLVGLFLILSSVYISEFTKILFP